MSHPREADRQLPWATACHPQHPGRDAEPHGLDLKEENDHTEVLLTKIMGFIDDITHNNMDCT